MSRWQGPAIVLREPWQAFWRRLGNRLLITAAPLAVAGIPGVWDGPLPWMWLRVLLWVFSALGLLLVLLSFANIAKNRRVLLVQRPSGVLERPASIQEGWLRRPAEWLEGADVVVTEELSAVVPSKADPRVTLAAGERRIVAVPLWGEAPQSLVDRANLALSERGMRLRFQPPEPPEQDAQNEIAREADPEG